MVRRKTSVTSSIVAAINAMRRRPKYLRLATEIFGIEASSGGTSTSLSHFDVSFRDRYPYRNQTLTEYVRVQRSPEAMRSATTVNARLFSRSRLRLCYVVMKCLLGAVPVGSPAVTTVLKPARVAMSDGRVFVDKGSEAAAVPLYGDKPYSNLAQRKPTCSLQNMRWEETFSWRAKT